MGHGDSTPVIRLGMATVGVNAQGIDSLYQQGQRLVIVGVHAHDIQDLPRLTGGLDAKLPKKLELYGKMGICKATVGRARQGCKQRYSCTSSFVGARQIPFPYGCIVDYHLVRACSTC